MFLLLSFVVREGRRREEISSLKSCCVSIFDKDIHLKEKYLN